MVLFLLTKQIILKTPCWNGIYLQIGIQSVRWHKPRWLPIAKSKYWFVPKPRVIIPEEAQEMSIRTKHYNTMMKSLRKMFVDENNETLRKEEEQRVQECMKEEEEFAELFELNNLENERMVEIREAGLAERFENLKVKILQKIEQLKERESKELNEREEMVHQINKEAKTFITRETLEAAIEFAIANPLDYNFCIDKEGKVSKGGIECLNAERNLKRMSS